MSWLGKRVELWNKKTNERKIGTVIDDGPTRTVFMSDDGEKLLASHWYYRPVVESVPRLSQSKKNESEDRNGK